MYVDGFTKDYEVAVVVSNDSDLLEPIRVARENWPNRGHPGPAEKTFRVLAQEADLLKQIRSGARRRASSGRLSMTPTAP